MDRDVNSAAFMLVRTAPGDFSTIWKSYVIGARASGVNSGQFVIEDLGTSVAGDGTRLLTIANNGYVGIGTATPSQKLSVQGNVISDSYKYNSSRQLKRDIKPLTNEECSLILDKLGETEICRYRFLSDGNEGEVHLGMIAEDVPDEISSTDGKSINLTDTVDMLLAAVKAQSREIEELRAEIAILKERRD